MIYGDHNVAYFKAVRDHFEIDLTDEEIASINPPYYVPRALIDHYFEQLKDAS